MWRSRRGRGRLRVWWLIAEAGAGLLVRYGDVDGLRANTTLIQDRTAASAMVERGRRYVSEQLGFEVIAQRHLRVYEAVCA